MKKSYLWRVLFWIILFGAGFLIGSSWTKKEVHESNKVVVTEPQESLEVQPANYTRKVEPSVVYNNAEEATINLFENAAPSVAFITTLSFKQNYWTRDITEIPRGSGSGFVWDKEGHIVTNFHVINNADKATVTLADQSTYEADLVGYAPGKDLAILKIKAPKDQLTPIPVGTSEDLKVGQSVYAIGNPFGLDQTLTTGIISALGREIKAQNGTPIRDVIQTDAAINPGNSGGPLLDSQGRLIGVNTAIVSPSGAYAGIGFSIPVDVVQWVVPDLINHGKVIRPTLGITTAQQRQLSRPIDGVLVLEVVDGSAAEEAGMKPTLRDRYGNIELGDIIIAIDDEKVGSFGDLQLALEKYKAGDPVKVKVRRGKKEVELDLILDPAR